jgi:hypothetical protein
MRRFNSMLHDVRLRVARNVAQFVAIAAASLPSAGA